MINTFLRRRYFLLRQLAASDLVFISANDISCSPSSTFCYITPTNNRRISNVLKTFGNHRHFCGNFQPHKNNRNFESPPTCWCCGEEKTHGDNVPFLVCPSCGAVQPLEPSIDYFQILGIEKKCEIKDEDDLEGKYKMWQKKLHPDLVHSKSQNEKEFAAEQSSRVIEAYRTLTNPLSLAIYIMKLEGVDVNEEETLTDMELLSEIMEIREAVEEASEPESLLKLQSQMQNNMRDWFNSFRQAFESRNFEEALECIRRLTYYDRVSQEIVRKL